jgi:hypothetical protein
VARDRARAGAPWPPVEPRWTTPASRRRASRLRSDTWRGRT